MKRYQASFVAVAGLRAKLVKLAVLAVTVVAAAWAWLPGCGGSSACSTMTCFDEFSATIKVDQNALPSGDHTLTVEKDGTPISCTFVFPPPAGSAGTQCPAGLSVVLSIYQTCTFTENVTGGIQTCTDVPGTFNERISVAGTPASVHVQQVVGATVVLDQVVSPTYAKYEPNGAGCGPVCQEASATWTIP
jgi:hypothetical protein